MTETKKKTTKKNTKKVTTNKTTKVETKVIVKKENKIISCLKTVGKKLGSFFNDPRPIIIVLLVLVGLFIVSFSNYKTKFKVYQGIYTSDILSIRTIHVYIHPKISTFYSSGAVYTGEEKKVYKYQIGYYYESGGEYKFIKESAEELNNPTDLGDLINKTSYFDYSEFANKGSLVFSRDAKANIGKLHFIVLASTTKDSEDFDIKIDCPIDFTEF